MTWGPNPEKKLHANRRYSIPYNGSQGRKCFSRYHHLYSEEDTVNSIKTMFGHKQNIEAASGWDRRNPSHYPQRWPFRHTIRRVPRVVILSSFIHWFEHWSSCVFLFPKLVVGGSICNPESNLTQTYYALDQWNGGAGATSGGGTQGRGPIQSAQYQRIVGSCTNQMALMHARLREIFLEVRDVLENDEKSEPIYVVIPNWTPPNLVMRSAPITQATWTPTNRPWNHNAESSYDITYDDNNIFYPDTEAPGNDLGFSYSGVPMLTCPEPGFGTNVLHMYFGQWTMKTDPRPSPFLYEIYPFAPPGVMLGSSYQGTYLGPPGIQLVTGRRILWRDCGYDYGYGAETNRDYYNQYNQTAVSNYREQFYKYRNFGLRLFNFDMGFTFQWNPYEIYEDQKIYHEGRFYFGADTCCEVVGCNEDSACTDAPDGELKFGDHSFKIDASAWYEDAIKNWFPPLRRRVEKYYDGLVPGNEAILQGTAQSLLDYNVKYEEDGASQYMDAGKIIDYIREYFMTHK